MKNIFFRQLEPGDHNQYKSVRLNCLRQYPNNFGTTYEEEDSTQFLKLTHAIQSADSSNFAFGAFNSNFELIGICGFVAETRLKARHRGEIVQLFVDVTYKEQGIGKRLLQLCVEKAFENKEVEQIILSVVYGNHNAINLYIRLGFTEYGRLENYFKTSQESLTQVFLYLDRVSYKK